MIPKDTALPEGRILNGRYRIWQKLGGGGFGLTYLATVRDAPVQGGLVVIKEHFPAWCVTRHPTTGQVCVNEGEQTRYDWSLDAFKHEAQQLSILNHPNIIRVTDAFEENNTAYYVMPYVRGGSLADGVKWLRRKGQRLSQAAVLKLMRALLSALEHMHHSTLRGVPVYHLDIKPGNILLSSNGVEELPVLIDFGSPEMGSPGFMPHEQRTPSAIGPWTDMYALAASIHKLLTGRTPASHLDEKCEALTTPPPQAPLAQNQELLACYDMELLESIDRALSWEPSRRFSDAAQWLRILDSIPLRLPDKGVDLLRLMLNIRTNELVAPVSLWETEESNARSSRQEWMRNLAIFLATAGAVSLLGVALLPKDNEETEPSAFSPEPESALPPQPKEKDIKPSSFSQPTQSEPSSNEQPAPAPPAQSEPITNEQPTPTPPAQPEPKSNEQPAPAPPAQSEPITNEQPTPTPPAQPEPKPNEQPAPAPPAQSEPITNEQPAPTPPAQPEPKSNEQPAPTPPAQPEPKPNEQPAPAPPAQPEPKPNEQPAPAPPAQPEPKSNEQPAPTPPAQPEPKTNEQPAPTPPAQSEQKTDKQPTPPPPAQPEQKAVIPSYIPTPQAEERTEEQTPRQKERETKSSGEAKGRSEKQSKEKKETEVRKPKKEKEIDSKRKAQQEQTRKPREKQQPRQRKVNSSGHVCPTRQEVLSAKKGRPVHIRLQQGAAQGCTRCKRYLESFEKTR